MKSYVINERGQMIPADLYAIQQTASLRKDQPSSTSATDLVRVQPTFDDGSYRVVMHQRSPHHTDTPEGRAWGQRAYANAVQMKPETLGPNAMRATFVSGYED